MVGQVDYMKFNYLKFFINQATFQFERVNK